jgi:hypothetical protein
MRHIVARWLVLLGGGIAAGLALAFADSGPTEGEISHHVVIVLLLLAATAVAGAMWHWGERADEDPRSHRDFSQ